MSPVGKIILGISLVSNFAMAQDTCLGSEEESLNALQSLRDTVECAGSENMQDCRDTIALGAGLVGLAAYGKKVGAISALRPRIKSLCGKVSASLFFRRADAAPINCAIDGRLMAKASTEYLEDLEKELGDQLEENKKSAARNKAWATERVRNSEMTDKLREIKRTLDKTPERLLLSPEDLARPNVVDRIPQYRLDVAKERSQAIGKVIKEIESMKLEKPEKVRALIQENFQSLVKGLYARGQFQTIMNRESNDRVVRFLKSIENLSPKEQLRIIQSKAGEIPGLHAYESSLRSLTSTQRELDNVRTTRLQVRNIGGNGPEEVLKKLKFMEKFSTSNTRTMGRAGIRFNNFKVVMNEVVAKGGDVRGAMRGVKSMAGKGVVRIGAGALIMAGSLPVMAAEAMLTPNTTSCNDDFKQGRYATYGEGCKAHPVIGEPTAEFLYNLSPEEQLKELQESKGFCTLIKEIHDQQNAERWKLSCTGRGFKLTDKKSDYPMAMDYETDESGKLSRMRYLSNRGPRLFATNNFAIEFNKDEEPASVVTAFKGRKQGKNKSAFNFQSSAENSRIDSVEHDRENKTSRIPANIALDPDKTRSYGYISKKYSTVAAAKYATSIGQMCCTETKADIDHLCKEWGVQRKRPSGSDSSKSDSGSSGNQ